jgi:YidC/Oxa1 family membrane protein insertase
MKFSIVQPLVFLQASSAFQTILSNKKFVGFNRRSCFTSPVKSHLLPFKTQLNIFTHELNHAIDLLQDLPSIAIADTASVASSGGWFDSYLNIFKTGLLFVHDVIDAPLKSAGIQQTWGLAIALFTAGVRTSLVPVSFQQSKNSEYMKALKPMQNEIREKYKDNKDMQNRYLLKLSEDAKVNPLSGCLFALLQTPVFIGLYRSVTGLAIEGRLDEPFLWIPSLAGPVSPPDYRGMDWLTTGWHSSANGFLEPQLGWETTLAFLVMPVVLVLGQAFTMSLLTPPLDEKATAEERETMEKSQGILKYLPLLIGYFSLQVPAGLTIYWMISNAFTVTQSVLVKAYYKAYPPKIELPDYWDALDADESLMTPEERRKAAEAGMNAGPKFSDMIDEAQHHYVVERSPLRNGSPSWDKVKGVSDVPSVLAEWVSKGSIKETIGA